MNKVICDICGTDYPETASQCPICGCAKGDGAQTAAGNATSEETAAYTYVRGGRFSKSNVRKRLKASKKQQEAEAQPQKLPDKKDASDEDFDEDELDNVSNKGLIVIVVLLLLAIVVVGSYIVITFLGDGANSGSNQTNQTQQTTPAPENPSTKPTEPQATGTVCTGLTLHDVEIVLENADAPWYELYWEVEPADTTEPISFSSEDTGVATVDANGVVTAVSNGETVITVKCGQFEAQCKVVCNLTADSTDDPATEPSENPDDPATEPTQDEPTTESTEAPDDTVQLTLHKTDFTLFTKGSSYQITAPGIENDKITWSSDNESIATVENGLVVAVGVGRTAIRATYNGQEAVCMVSCRWEETTDEPTEETPEEQPPAEENPEQQPPVEETPENPPSEEITHSLLVNGAAPNYLYNEQENSAEFTLTASENADVNQCRIAVSNAEQVSWVNSNEAVCSVDANGKVTALSRGTAILTAEVDGITFTVCVRVQ